MGKGFPFSSSRIDSRWSRRQNRSYAQFPAEHRIVDLCREPIDPRDHLAEGIALGEKRTTATCRTGSALAAPTSIAAASAIQIKIDFISAGKTTCYSAPGIVRLVGGVLLWRVIFFCATNHSPIR